MRILSRARYIYIMYMETLLNICNHPKRADFYMKFLLVNFAVKNAMFNL